MGSSTVRRRVLVHGVVQGVFFRDTCRREADARGVCGWVRNRSDGTVEAVFEGSPEAVDAMISWTRHGPPTAQVRHVETVEEPVEGVREFAVH